MQLVLGVTTTCFALGSQRAQVVTFSVPDAAASVRLALARCTPSTANYWNKANQTVSWKVEQSNDGGVTWFLLGGSTAAGGQVIDSTTGTAATESWDIHALAPGTSRQIRITFTPSTSIFTAGTVLVS